MQGQYTGFSALLKQEAPAQVHVWCYAHILNLVLADTTGIVVSSASLFSLLNDIATFIRESYKCMNVWEEVSEDSRHRRIAQIEEDQALCKVFGHFGNPEGALFIELVTTMAKMEKDNTIQTTVRVKARDYMEALLR